MCPDSTRAVVLIICVVASSAIPERDQVLPSCYVYILLHMLCSGRPILKCQY